MPKSRAGARASRDATYHPGVMSQLAIERRRDGQGVVLVLAGELDTASAPDLEKVLAELEAAGASYITLELADLTFVDSAGASVLIRAKQEADTSGRVLILRHATAQVQRVFAAVGLAEWLA